jgi:hypothetical protein
MKYLKLYEAFKSKGISNTLKFLKDKVGQNEVNKFIEGLKRFMDYSGFPIDKISDDDLKYMRGKNALSLRTGEDKVTNPKGIEFIKFWFSLEKGYLGYTGTGNKEIEFKKENTNSSTGLKSEEKFTDMELERIKTGYELKGEIWPVTNYNKLKTGDSVIGFYDHDRTFRKFDIGVAYVDTSGRYYVLQDVSDGSTPDDSGYTRFGKSRTWFIYEPDNEIGGDHRCLHYYKPTSEELHYVENKENENKETEEPEEDPLDWNLPLDGLQVSRWNWGGDSFRNHEKLKESDFSLVLYYDKMTNPDVDAPHFEPVGAIKKGREQDKKGALALMTDDKVRKENLERYISKLSSNIEISKEDLNNLGKILIKAILGEFSFISIHQNRKSNLDRLSNICSQLYAMMSDPSSESYYIDSVKNYYKQLNETYYKDLTYSLEIKSLIKGTEAEKIFNRIFELGTLISDLIRKQNAQSIDDVLILYQKISSIRNFMHIDQNRPSYYIRNIFSEFYSKSSVEYYLREFNDSYDESNYQDDIKRLERVEKYIKSIL